MVEHVGAARSTSTRRRLHRLLRPGGRLLNHGDRAAAPRRPEAGPFSERYVFPDAAPLHLSRIQRARARRPGDRAPSRASGWTTRETLTHWAQRLDDNAEQAERLVGAERMRIWRLYLRAARNNFDSGFRPCSRSGREAPLD